MDIPQVRRFVQLGTNVTCCNRGGNGDLLITPAGACESGRRI